MVRIFKVFDWSSGRWGLETVTWQVVDVGVYIFFCFLFSFFPLSLLVVLLWVGKVIEG